MFEIATLTSENVLKLPAEIAKRFLPADRFIVWLEGDVLHLKRLEPSPLKAVDEAPEEQPMPLDEISAIVHKVRQSRAKRQAQ
jgi:hypothetical protein